MEGPPRWRPFCLPRASLAGIGGGKNVPAAADRLFDRGNRRDALSSRRRGSHRRHFGYAVRRRGRREKARVSAFTSADIPKILALQPDLVLTFSDLQADIAATLIRQGVDVHAFNQRTVAQILDMVVRLAPGWRPPEPGVWRDELAGAVEWARRAAAQAPRRPKVYFEEWDDPMISGIGWVSELIEPPAASISLPISRLANRPRGAS